ncbi:MAG: hypothetical protein RMX96_21430 [Nostoc sp. ChiSLP02]|nr:hypothetical protein [Nostoc sp. DedSLP05]MDZ8098088.1 hypothetical protein [Nostoc sp. DedSLP01]MDZ8187395.1 hypothetical protein [Nostoc sp. ChiSLP02]
MSGQEKEKIFHTELVKYGVKYEKAQKAAQLLASGKPDELLTQQERQIVLEACYEWSKQRKRYKHLKSLLDSERLN